MAFNGDYQQLAAALINQHAVAGAAAAAPPPPPEPIAKYGGMRIYEYIQRYDTRIIQ